MFDRYLITADSFKNSTDENGAVVGYSFAVRIGYYRGLAISMVEPFDIIVDGEVVDPDDVTFTVSGQTFTYGEMESRADVRWEMQDDAMLTVTKVGGLAPGEHDVELNEWTGYPIQPNVEDMTEAQFSDAVVWVQTHSFYKYDGTLSSGRISEDGVMMKTDEILRPTSQTSS